MPWPIKAKIFVKLRCVKYFQKILFWNQLLPKQQFFLGNQNCLCKTPGNPLLTDLYPTMILWYNVDSQNSQFKRFATIATMSPWKPKICIHDRQENVKNWCSDKIFADLLSRQKYNTHLCYHVMHGVFWKQLSNLPNEMLTEFTKVSNEQHISLYLPYYTGVKIANLQLYLG